MRDLRKKNRTKLPKTPSIDQDALLARLMRKHDISYNQALRMSIEIDAEKGIADNSKWKLLKALEDEEMGNMLDKDQISPENIVEYTTTEGEIFNILKLRKEMHRSTVLSSLIGLPIPANLDACNVSDVTSQHPEVISMKKKLEEAEKEKAELKKEKDNLQETLVRVVSIQSDSPPKKKKPPEIQTKKNQVLNKLQKHYELTLLNNGKQRIGLKVFYKTKEVQDILKWGKKKLGVTVAGKTIADRMRTVNKDFGVNAKRGRPPTSVPKQKNKEPITKKLDLDKYDEEFLADDF